LKLIRSRDNPQVKALVKLASSSRERRDTGTTLLEGEHLVRAYRESGGKAETIFAAETAMTKPEIRALIESAPAAARLVLADRLVEQISQLVSTAGVGAVVRTPKAGPPPRTLASCVLLENIQDPGNLGSILRSAAAAGIAEIFLSRGSVFAWSPKVIRAGMGAHFGLSIFEDVELPEIARACSGRIVAMEPRAKASLYELDLTGPVAWAFGNEGAGLSEGLRRLASDTACIPMPGSAESLNVAAAAAICLFEQVRQNAQTRKPEGAGFQ
jgi:TrmH family RNA methyltransferase